MHNKDDNFEENCLFHGLMLEEGKGTESANKFVDEEKRVMLEPEPFKIMTYDPLRLIAAF